MVPAVVASPLTLASLLLVPVAAGCLSSDSGDTVDCTLNYLYGLSVTVDNGASNDECLVTVTISEGEYVEELMCGPQGSACSCYGAGERAGTYLVEVMTEDDVVASQEVTVQEDRCHVKPERVTLSLP